MGNKVRITLEPLGEKLSVAIGTPLREVLPAYGVEFPCGGKGICDGCRVRVLKGHLPETPQQEEILGKEDLSQGWRLMCRCEVLEDVTLDVAQWDPAILGDHSDFEFTPSRGLGVAVDLGTTTIVGQLLDLESGKVLAVRSSLNPQVAHGGDVMTRVEFGLDDDGLQRLRRLALDEVGQLVLRLFDLEELDISSLNRVVLTGNTVMHHIFSGLPLQPLSYVPFESPNDARQVFSPAQLGWELPADVSVEFLPCLGGFVGSDILAGLMALKMHEREELTALIDLGTNGEIAVGNRDKILCASTAAGPAFEGGRIRMGMRATSGAISQVYREEGQMSGSVLGDTVPRGICGSGLVDAVAVALDLGLVLADGRIPNNSRAITIISPVRLFQKDIRELQLAKAAVAAGLDILLNRLGRQLSEIDRLFLAGAFGNYVNRTSASRIGLIKLPVDRVRPAGNTSLRGAKLALFEEDWPDREFSDLRGRIEHVSLVSDAQFQDLFVNSMAFPKVWH